MALRIYPSIGIARVGNNLTKFYIGLEIPGHPGFEPDGQDSEKAVSRYKVDEDQIKRQAARFRLFDVPDDGAAPREAQLPAGAVVEWTVHLVNKKNAIQRTAAPVMLPRRPQFVANPAPLLIDPGAQSISAANAGGVKFDGGEFLGRRVPLGELRTDKNQNLLVLGGFGFSSSPTNAGLPSFYTNPGWHDDVADGPVKARIRLQNGNVIDNIAPAWVLVAPPDFAPEINGVVTLYDIMLQVGIDHFGVPRPAEVSFTRDVFPLLLRTSRLQWVNVDPNWSEVSEDWSALADRSAGALQIRADNAERVRQTEAILSRVVLTDLQGFILDQWVDGNFKSDWAGIPQSANAVTADGMTRAALQSAVGQGFFPGIEAGILTTDRTLYSNPFDFRLDHGQAKAGDLTAQMAVPWQADFNDCDANWWPSQRPNDVRPSPTSTNVLSWDRGVTTHLSMINNFSKLAFITAQRNAQGNIVFAEDQRAPSSLIA
jgi:hypothetical protein